MRLPDPVERPVLSVEEAGKLLGLGRSAAYEAVRRGEIPVLRFGRRLCVPCAALRRLVGLDEPTAPTAAPDEALRLVSNP